jgi:AAA family ATP:ADP antiporter
MTVSASVVHDADVERPVPALRILGDVRRDEVRQVLLLAANCFVALVAYYVLKVVREPLILNTGGATAKSYAAAVQALLLVLLVPAYGRFLARSDRRRLVQGVVLVFFACIELFYLGNELRVPYLGFVFFVWVGIFSLAIVAQFWSLANDLYATEAGERLFPVIALGAPVGSVAGSFLARQLIGAGLGPSGLLQVAAGLLLVHLLVYRTVLRGKGPDAQHAGRSEPQAISSASERLNGLTLVMRNPYLWRIAVLLVVLNLVNTTGEFILGLNVTIEAKRAFALAASSTAGLAHDKFLDDYVGGFYAEFFTLVNILSMGLQAFVASRLVARFGIAGALFALPVVAAGAYGLIAAGAGLSAVRNAKVAENSTDYSIMNTARALLWLPTSRTEKYAGKQAIDTFFVRLGDMLSAGVVFVATLLLGGEAAVAQSELAPRLLAGFNLLLTVLWFALAFGLTRRYTRLAAQAGSSSNPSAAG